MTKIQVHINPPEPSVETIRKYKSYNYNYKHSGTTRFINYQGLQRIFFKKRNMVIGFIMILVTLLVFLLC
jgi:hypothetical protein